MNRRELEQAAISATDRGDMSRSRMMGSWTWARASAASRSRRPHLSGRAGSPFHRIWLLQRRGKLLPFKTSNIDAASCHCLFR